VSSRTLPLERDGRGERTGSDIEIITLVSGAHFLSHFLQLTLPPLFPLLRAVFNVPYVALGVLMTLFYSASAVGQLVSGFLVDRFGARRILVGGLSLFASAIVLAGLSPSYGMLVAVILLAGLGNSVFHPADYSIMNATVDSRRLGRAYSTHSISGNIGWALAPAVVGGLTAAFGWRVALVTAGALGLAAALFLARQAGARQRRTAPGAARAPDGSHRLRQRRRRPLAGPHCASGDAHQGLGQGLRLRLLGPRSRLAGDAAGLRMAGGPG